MTLRHEFPIRVTGPDVLPTPLGEIYVLTLQRGACRQAIYAPALGAFAALGRQAPAGRLLMVFDDCLFIAVANKGKSETFYVPFGDVIRIELAALTTHQLMLITEEPSQFGVGRKREGQYGHIYTYCPLSRIGELEIEARPSKPGLNDMRLTLVNDRARLLIGKLIDAEAAPRFEWLGRCMSECLTNRMPERATTLMAP